MHPMTTIKTREPAADPSPPHPTAANTTSNTTTVPKQDSKLKESKLKSPKPSRWTKARRRIARHPRLVTTVVLLSLASGTGLFLLYLLFRGAWSSHQDNLAILHTIFKMEIAQEDTLEIDQNPQQVVTRTYLTLEPHVGHDGWMWVNRFGSTITYGKYEQRLIASCSSYSPLYLVCDLSEIP